MIIAIMLIPIDKKYQYAFVKNACSLQSNYIYHRTFEDSTPIDIIFLGSSHTMCGISQSTVQTRLSDLGIYSQVCNMAFCRLGRDMDYILFKDIIQYKKPKMLILEVRQDEPELGHPDFGYMADLADVLSAPLVVNQSYFTGLKNAYLVRMNYARDLLSHINYNSPYEAPRLNFLEKTLIADTAILYGAARNRWQRYYSHTRPKWVEQLMTRYPKKYIQMIMDMAQKHQIKVIMLYVPNFGYPYHRPKELLYYQQMADVMIMPDSFYDNEKYWREDEHLNSPAALILSDSVADFISRRLY